MTAGRDRFTALALEHLAQAVAADELGVERRRVAARIRDQGGSLAVRVTSPLAMPPLTIEPETPLTVRLGEAGGSIRERLTALTGLAVVQVDIRATGAVLTERRVR